MNRAHTLDRVIRCLAWLTAAALAQADEAGPGGAADWYRLEAGQSSLTLEQFTERLKSGYAPRGGLEDYVLYRDGAVDFFADAARTNAPVFTLRFAADDASARRVSKGWKTAADAAALANPADAPLRGLRIALDPGHIGGAWARMEERFFVGDRSGWFVQEAALNLLVARRLRDRLQADGATVLMVKDGFEPVTRARPEDLMAEARALEAPLRFPRLPELFRDADRDDRVRRRAEFLFYRREEIRARAERVNRDLKPDLTVCLHFNAVELPPGQPFTADNAVLVYVHGNYLPEELADPAQRARMIAKLLDGVGETERGAAAAVANALARATGLPAPRIALGGGEYPVGENPYVRARNLAANRQYDGPVIFTEAYYMNNREVFARIQAGDYDGARTIGGRSVPSLFREYADAVADGLRAYYAPRPE